MIWKQFLRFGFRLLYNELAWTYDTVSWFVSLGEWRAWQQAALPLVKGSRVLEIGHGPGHMLLALDAAGYRVTGLDLSPYMGRQAARRFKKAGVSIPLIRGDAASLPLADAVFDTVLATFPTEYIANPAVLAEVHRVLGENGRFLIIPAAGFTNPRCLYRFIEWLYAITGQRKEIFAIEPKQNWLADAILQRFTDAGFRVEMDQVHLTHSVVTRLIAYKDIG